MRLLPRPRGALVPFILLAVSLLACGSVSESGAPVGPGLSSGGAGSGEEGPQVTIAMRGSTAAAPHHDDFSSQTPTKQAVAVKSLSLLAAGDTAPRKIFDLGSNAVEADLISGKATDIASVPLGSLPAGTFTTARVGVAYVRYSVAARMHSGFATDGRYDNVQALSAGAVIDGKPRAQGWFTSAFTFGTTTVGPTEFAKNPLPQLLSSGGMRLDSTGPDAFYEFPVALTIRPDESSNYRVVCEINVHENFRWQDEGQPGYTAKVFDTTPTTYEAVMSFGASSFALVREAP